MPVEVLPSDPEQVRMTFGEHLEELRWRLVKAVGSVAIGFALRLLLPRHDHGLLRPPVPAGRPLGRPSQYLIALHPTEVFMIVLKICALVGILLSSPYAFYQIWAFVAAGLYPRERSLVTGMVPYSVGLFRCGRGLPVLHRPAGGPAGPAEHEQLGAHCRRPSPTGIVSLLMGERVGHGRTPTTQPEFPKVPILDADPASPPPSAIWINQNEGKLKIALDAKKILVSDLHLTDASMVESRFDLGEYVSFATGLAFGFGLGFQVPLVVLLLSRIGIVSAAQMAAVPQVRHHRRLHRRRDPDARRRTSTTSCC